jgi:hypothetical protein
LGRNTQHAGSVLESQFRERFPGSSPYWEGGNIELDCVRFQGDSHVVVSEVKLGSLSQQTKISLLGELKRKVENSKLVRKFDKIDCEVLAFEGVIASLG